MDILSTDKKWEDVFPAAGQQIFLQLLEDDTEYEPAAASTGVPVRGLFLFYGAKQHMIAAAALAGAQVGKKTYRINADTLMAADIKETEKNIKQVFEAATANAAVLLFDEADALLTKRTTVKDSHDKYANQEISYLLQQIEQYKGTVILAVTNKQNIDPGFIRRVQQLIHFPPPKKD
ncbi:MAG: ATP-binding protein [Chitinophagaceae bacterium]